MLPQGLCELLFESYIFELLKYIPGLIKEIFLSIVVDRALESAGYLPKPVLSYSHVDTAFSAQSGQTTSMLSRDLQSRIPNENGIGLRLTGKDPGTKLRDCNNIVTETGGRMVP